MPWRICLLGVIAATLAGSAYADSIWWATTAFGDNGVAVVQDGSVIADPTAVAVAPDGDVLMAGSDGPVLALFRFTADGRSIGFGPRSLPVFLATREPCSAGLAVRKDGTIVVVCGDLVASLRSDGSIESLENIGYAIFNAVVIDDSGRTIAVGTDGSGGDGLVMRFLRSGRLDRSFDSGGLVYLDNLATGVAIDGSDILVVTGGAVDELDDDGALLRAFTRPGFMATSVAVRRGHVIAAGAAGANAAVARFLANGTPDASFGVDGIASWQESGGAASSSAVAVGSRADGSVDVATLATWPTDSAGEQPETWLVHRLTMSGRLRGETGDGPGFIDPTAACEQEIPAGLAEQPNGKVIAVGVACPDRATWGNGDEVSALVRYTADLGLDVGVALKLTALGSAHVRGRDVTLHVGVNGPCRLIARLASRRVIVDVAHSGAVTLDLHDVDLRSHTVAVHAYDARGRSVHVLVQVKH